MLYDIETIFLRIETFIYTFIYGCFMVKINKMITLDETIVYHPKFAELIKERSLSTLINTLLMKTFDIKEDDVNQQEEELKSELKNMDVKRARIQKRIDVIEEKKPKLTDEEIAEGWFIDPEDGKKWRIKE